MRTIAPLLSLVFLFLASPVRAETPTERYAPAQLRVAQDLLDRARAFAALGEVERAGKLAWQANLDARLAWGMTESPHLRAEAAEVGGAARALVTRLAGRR
jgi:hypothetical protein